MNMGVLYIQHIVKRLRWNCNFKGNNGRMVEIKNQQLVILHKHPNGILYQINFKWKYVN